MRIFHGWYVVGCAFLLATWGWGLGFYALGVYLVAGGSGTLARVLAVAFFLVALFFVHRSFYGMRIESGIPSAGRGRPAAVKA